jgi:hypothetical protein
LAFGYKAWDAPESGALSFGSEVFNNSRSTYLTVRKDAYEGIFCMEEPELVVLRHTLAFRYRDSFQTDCMQKGFSFAPSSTNASVPAPGASIWLSGFELYGEGTGKMVASGFEGFAAGQTVETDVPEINYDERQGADPIRRIQLRNGPYKMAFNQVFDAANFLKFEGSTNTTYVYATCRTSPPHKLYGKYSA